MKTQEPYPIIAPVFGLAIAFCSMAGWGPRAAAHDFFLLPSDFRPAAGELVDVWMHVSELFPGQPGPWRSNRVAELLSVQAGGRTDLTPRQPSAADDETPTPLTVSLGEPGPCIVALATQPSFIDLKPEEFAEYVAKEGHTEVVDALRRMKTRHETVREKYSRYVKTILHVRKGAGGTGSAKADVLTRPVGLRIEIVPLVDPAGVPLGGNLPVEVLFDGRPLAGALVSAVWAGFPKEHEAYAFSARTDERGRVSVPIVQTGTWFVRVSKMVPLTGRDSEAQWESFWAALTFEVPGP